MQHDPKIQATTPERERDEFDAAERDPATGNYILQGPFGMTQSVPEAEIERVRAERRKIADARKAATLTRLPFQLHRACTKCGHGPSVADAEQAPEVKYCHDVSHHAPHLGEGEALVRTCRRCGYEWAEQTIDATAEGR